MSRIGKKSIVIPEGVTVAVKGPSVSVSGPRGSLTLKHAPGLAVKTGDGVLIVSVADPSVKKIGALWGMTRALLANMVMGVTQGFVKRLEINGVGFKAAVQGRNLHLTVGFSHPVQYAVPEGVDVTVEKNVISVSGADRQLVGRVAAEVRDIWPPEPYKGKGIKYVDEVIRRKVGKVIKSGS